jgi:hypothetical protein
MRDGQEVRHRAHNSKYEGSIPSPAKTIEDKVETKEIVVVEEIEEKKKKLSSLYRRIAELSARGWSHQEISEEVGRTQSRISQILTRDDVWDYVTSIIRSTFSEGDRILSTLYKKTMVGLDQDVSSPDPDIRKNAREQVLKVWGYGRDKSLSDEDKPRVSLVQQFFGSGSGQKTIQTMDDVILQSRKERGLDISDKEEVIEIEEVEDEMSEISEGE